MHIKIHEIGGYAVRNYLLETPDGIIAIDTGYAGQFPAFRAKFERLWPLSELRHIFLTHHHDDHSGFLGELMASTDAKVILHPLAVEYLKTGQSHEKPGAGYSSFTASLFSLVKKDFSFPPVSLPPERAIIVETEDDQPFEELGLPFRILHLPGHTDDSIGLFLPQTGELFCGDAAMNAVISKARHTIWIEDVAEFHRSWDKMLSLDPGKIYPSHGNPFPPKDLSRYRHYLDCKTLIPGIKRRN
ncbi:MAG: MBL fold metallo-hydrolase [Oscillospiraceae bacterium]|jgi:glyoxylase-like metal-dependent hydrolase (beta-lactamase superfamily II)|nr:MBL fold metallo-hydrolase [Oscillospiraceae bacterium]